MKELHAPTLDECTPLFEDALDFVADQSSRILDQYPGYYPMYTVNGKWNQEGERWTHWCEGFFPGVLWLLYKVSEDEQWLEPARELSHRLEPRQFDREVHDLGFLFFSTYLREYRITQDPALKNVLIQAGRTLALRRQIGGYLCSFIGPESLFIDIMMNVGLIFWAANATEDETLRAIALEHCRTSAKYLVRPDGGTAHEAIFDVKTGDFLRESTHQGWKPETTWARGLAWAIYGFTAAHRLLNQNEMIIDELLEVAQRCAEYYLTHAPEGLVPLWDFDLPASEPQLWDSSAAAIAASGLQDLSEEIMDESLSQRYQGASRLILKTLCSDEFLPRNKPEWEGFLMHGIYHYHKGLGVDESVAWGEHFFVEALAKAIAEDSEAGW